MHYFAPAHIADLKLCQILRHILVLHLCLPKILATPVIKWKKYWHFPLTPLSKFLIKSVCMFVCMCVCVCVHVDVCVCVCVFVCAHVTGCMWLGQSVRLPATLSTVCIYNNTLQGKVKNVISLTDNSNGD